MKFEIDKKMLKLIPECDMDLYNIGVLHTQYGGSICYDSQERKILAFTIDPHTVVDFLILHASDNSK